MRFCMVTTFYPPYHFGGDAIFVQSLARALVAQGHHVEVVHCEDAHRLRSREQPAAQVEQDGVVVHRLRSRYGGDMSPVDVAALLLEIPTTCVEYNRHVSMCGAMRRGLSGCGKGNVRRLRAAAGSTESVQPFCPTRSCGDEDWPCDPLG